jgi:FkbM family methyltransferase
MTKRVRRIIHRLIWTFPVQRFMWFFDMHKHTMVWSKLNEAAAAGQDITFVNIGSNDGLTNNPLAEFIATHNWRGIMVEPVGYVFQRLEKNYAGKRGIILVNAAVSDHSGTGEFWRLDRNSVLSPVYDKLGSLDKKQLENHNVAGKDKFISSEQVKLTTLAELLEKNNIRNPDVVVIDAEGHDGVIVRQIDFTVPPKLIVFEHSHLKNEEKESIYSKLREHGYDILPEGEDTIAQLKTA